MNILQIMSLHSTIQTMQFYVQKKGQNRLKHYLPFDLTIQAICDCSERSIKKTRLKYYLSIDLTIRAICDCSKRSIFYTIILIFFKALIL